MISLISLIFFLILLRNQKSIKFAKILYFLFLEFIFSFKYLYSLFYCKWSLASLFLSEQYSLEKLVSKKSYAQILAYKPCDIVLSDLFYFLPDTICIVSKSLRRRKAPPRGVSPHRFYWGIIILLTSNSL